MGERDSEGDVSYVRLGFSATNKQEQANSKRFDNRENYDDTVTL